MHLNSASPFLSTYLYILHNFYLKPTVQPQPFLQQQSSPRHEEAPFWARNLQGNVFHLFYLSFLAGLEDLLLRLTTSLFMDFNQVCQAATTTTICLSLDLAPKISLTCAVGCCSGIPKISWEVCVEQL